ncbi:Arginine--tRNA ligase [Folsomia candida]|uniref:Arginine--tRNA ligase n=1 Tax=Folsomia candida TaxID=158441 RepID=A0A226EDZ8_FOLCA|nr:Arginine--tRNA ligase [Folsomia candida]
MEKWKTAIQKAENSILKVLSASIKDASMVENIPEKLASPKSDLNLGNHRTAKVLTPTKTRSARQSNYPFIIYGGCYPPGLSGGWGWGSPYDPFQNQDRDMTWTPGNIIEIQQQIYCQKYPKRWLSDPIGNPSDSDRIGPNIRSDYPTYIMEYPIR